MESNQNLFTVEDSMFSEVLNLEKLMNEEKERQKIEAETEKNQKKRGRKPKINIGESTNKKSKSNLSIVNKENKEDLNTFIKNVNPVEIESFKMERLHLRLSDTTIDVLYRPIHSYIALLPNNEVGMSEVKRLAELSKEDFTKYLKGNRLFRMPNQSKLIEIKSSSLEVYYRDAWSRDTKAIFKQLGIENPIEEAIYQK